MDNILWKVIGIVMVLVLVGTVISGQVSNIKSNADKGQKDQQRIDILLSESDTVTGVTVKDHIRKAIQSNSNYAVTYTNTGSPAVTMNSGNPMPTNIKDKAVYNVTNISYNANGESTSYTFIQKDLSN